MYSVVCTDTITLRVLRSYENIPRAAFHFKYPRPDYKKTAAFDFYMFVILQPNNPFKDHVREGIEQLL